jgi:hypothetical protein
MSEENEWEPSEEDAPPPPDRSQLPLTLRRFESRCHICKFIQDEPEFGSMLEAQLLDPSYDNHQVADWFNRKFGMLINEEDPSKWSWKPDWKVIDQKKIRTHLQNHVTDQQEMLRRARERGITGNITLERNVMNMISITDALVEGGAMKVADGSIQVNSLSDLMKVMEIQHKFLGGDKVEITVGGTGGVNMPPNLIMMIIQTMEEFIPQEKRQQFRLALDQKVFPEWAKYAERWEHETGRKIDEPMQEIGPGTIDGSASDK